MSLTFQIAVHPPGVVIISLKGKILSEDPFLEVIETAETKILAGERNFLLDLKEVSHVNSSGLNVLLRLFTRIRNKGGEMVIINPSKTVNQLFTISKLNTVFKIKENKNEALKEFNK